MRNWLHTSLFLGLSASFAMAQVVGSTPPPELVEAGRKVAASLPRLEPGRELNMYFHIMVGPTDVVGAAVVTLKAVKDGDDVVYRYSNHAAIRSPNDKRNIAEVSATLKPTFEPLRVEVRRRQINPDGTGGSALQIAEVKKNELIIRAVQGESEDRQVRELPPRHWIYGFEMWVAMVDHEKYPSYLVHELDVGTGAARPLAVQRDEWEDGTPTILSWVPDGPGSYQFWFTSEGKLARWAERSMPFMFVTTTRDKARQTLASISGRGLGE